MNSLVDTLEHAGLVLTGGILFFLYLQWRKYMAARAHVAEADTLLDQARHEAEIVLRDARVAAGEEALKLHEQTEQGLATRRAERLELERRLAEREGLINSQLQRIVDAEANLTQEKAILRKQTDH